MKLKSIKSDSEKKEILIILSCDHITSVNNLYNARVGKKNGKHFPIIYRSPEAVKMTDEVTSQLNLIDFKTEAPWIWETDYFNMTVQYVINKSFGARDLSNMTKLQEDILFRHLELNDSRNIEIHTYKSYLPESSEEYIMVKLAKSNFDFMFRNGL